MWCLLPRPDLIDVSDSLRLVDSGVFLCAPGSVFLWFGECGGDAAYEFRDGNFLQITKKLSVCAPFKGSEFEAGEGDITVSIL
jgi:hypothetical protein